MTSLKELDQYLPLKRCFRASEVAEFLSTSHNDVKRMCRHAEIEAFKKGVEWRITRTSLAEYIQKNSNIEK